MSLNKQDAQQSTPELPEVEYSYIYSIRGLTPYYVLTRERRWLDITLNKRSVKKLRDLKQKTGKSISRIIEEAVDAF